MRTKFGQYIKRQKHTVKQLHEILNKFLNILTKRFLLNLYVAYWH